MNEENTLPRWVQKNPQLVFGMDIIQYRHLDEKQKFEAKKIKEIFKDLKKSTNKDMPLTELVTCFEGMGKVIAKDANYEFLEDMFFMQAETVTYKNRLMYGFLWLDKFPTRKSLSNLEWK